MIGVAGYQSHRVVQVVIGVDTHQDKHVAVAVDRQGIRVGECHVPATTHGYQYLERWSHSLGDIGAFGMEGTGSYGAGVARFLTNPMCKFRFRLPAWIFAEEDCPDSGSTRTWYG